MKNDDAEIMVDNESEDTRDSFGGLKFRAEQDRQWMLRAAFVCSVLFSVSLTVGFLFFVFMKFEPGTMDWHVLLLGSTMILPAAFVLYMLVRSGSVRREGTPEPPAQFPAERLAEGVAQLFEAIASRVGK